MSTRSLKLGLCFVICTALMRAPVLAQADADNAEYSRAVSEALIEFNERRFEEARALFLKAHALRPNARTLRALGNVAFELRNYVDCIEYLTGALASADQPLTPSMRAETENTLARAAAFTARVELTVEPTGAKVTVDNEAPRVQADGALLLSIGRHELIASLSGHASAQRVLDVRGGELTRLHLLLPPNEVAATPRTMTPRPFSDAPPASSGPSILERWWFWTAVSVVVVGAGAGILIATSSSSSQLQEPIPGNVGQTRTLLRGER
jgi:hypothetical protein